MKKVEECGRRWKKVDEVKEVEEIDEGCRRLKKVEEG